MNKLLIDNFKQLILRLFNKNIIVLVLGTQRVKTKNKENEI